MRSKSEPTQGFPRPPRWRATTWLAIVLLLALAIPFRAFLDNSVAPEHVFGRNDEVHYVPRVMGFLRGEWGDFNFINPAFSLHLFHAATALFGWVLVLAGRFDFLLMLGAWALGGGLGILAARLLRGDRARSRAGVQAAAVLVLGGLTVAPTATETLQLAQAFYGRPDPRGELVLWVREHLEPGRTYVSFVQPPRLSPRSLEVHKGHRPPPEQTDLRLVPLVVLVRRSPTFEELRAELEQHGPILVAIKTYGTFLRQGRTLPDLIAAALEYSAPIRESSYGSELHERVLELAHRSLTQGMVRVARSDPPRDDLWIVGLLAP